MENIDVNKQNVPKASMREVGKKGLIGLINKSNDQGLKRLVSVMSWSNWNLVLDENFNIIYDPDTKNIYAGCVACRATLQNAVAKYLDEKSSEEFEEIVGHIPEGELHSGPSTNVCFTKKFEDGVVYFATFGQYWASKPGYSRVMFGRIVKKKERPNL